MAGYRKLGRTSSQRKALLRNQVTDLLYHGKIRTTEAKAKEIRKIAEGLIALGVREKDNFNEVTVTRTSKDGETIEKVVIPEGTVLIGDSAFMECTMLWDITLPSTVKTIENHAFQHTGHSSGKRPIVALPRGITTFTANNDAGWACFNESAAVLVAPAGSYVATELYENWWVYYNTVADAEAGVNLRYKPNDDPDFEWNGNR